MKALLPALSFALLAAVASVRGQTAPLLRFELEHKSTALGLALLLDLGDEIGVYPFDRAPQFRKLPSSGARPMATPDGRIIVWAIQGAPYSSTIEMESVTAGILTKEQVDSWLQIIAATSNNPPNIAFISNLTELRYRISGSRASHVIEGMGTISSAAGWSPDGTKLVFGRGGQIRVLDTTNNRTTIIDQGADPTWSPDGRWIAYRPSTTRAVLFDPRSSKKKLILEGRELAPLPLRWSPDSEYLTYVDRNMKDKTQWHLSVFRVRDNAVTVVTPFDPIRGYVADWSWIFSYQTLCRRWGTK